MLAYKARMCEILHENDYAIWAMLQKDLFFTTKKQNRGTFQVLFFGILT